MFCTRGHKQYFHINEGKGNLFGYFFLNTNLPEESVQALFSDKVLSKLPGNILNIFLRSNIDRYMGRPSATFCNEKYSNLNDFCYAEFLAYYTLENKSSNNCKCQRDQLDRNPIKINHKESTYLK